MSRLQGYSGPQMIIIGAPESEYERNGRLYRAARARLIATVVGKLRAGHLVARGRDPRSAGYLPPGIFPAEAWQRLKVAIGDLSVVDGDVLIRDVQVCLAEDAEAPTGGPLPDPLQLAAPARLIIYTRAHRAELDGRRVRLRNQDLKLLLLLASRISSRRPMCHSVRSSNVFGAIKPASSLGQFATLFVNFVRPWQKGQRSQTRSRS
jgi:hypothetical protein